MSKLATLKVPFPLSILTLTLVSVFEELIPAIPSSVIRVAESGISTRADVAQAQKAGATAILVGESLVKSGDPISAMRELLGRG